LIFDYVRLLTDWYHFIPLAANLLEKPFILLGFASHRLFLAFFCSPVFEELELSAHTHHYQHFSFPVLYLVYLFSITAFISPLGSTQITTSTTSPKPV